MMSQENSMVNFRTKIDYIKLFLRYNKVYKFKIHKLIKYLHDGVTYNKLSTNQLYRKLKLKYYNKENLLDVDDEDLIAYCINYYLCWKLYRSLLFKYIIDKRTPQDELRINTLYYELYKIDKGDSK